MQAFARHYHDHVWPLLARQARHQGVLVSLGYLGWAEAHDALVALARSRGAGHLPDPAWQALEDRLATALATHVDRVDHLGERAEAFRRAHPARWWRSALRR